MDPEHEEQSATPAETVFERNHILRIAKQSAEMFYRRLEEYESNDLNIIHKSDGSPVTPLEKHIQQLIFDALHQYYPNSDLYGEESGKESSEESGAKYTVQNAKSRIDVDPLDGTSALEAWLKLSPEERRGTLPDCNILIGQRRYGDGRGFGCVVRLAQKKIYWYDGEMDHAPVVVDIEKGRVSTVAIDQQYSNQDDRPIYARVTRHGKWDVVESRRGSIIAKFKEVFKSDTALSPADTERSLVIDTLESGHMIDFILGKYAGIIILPMTGHVHDLAAAINIVRAMPGVQCGNLTPPHGTTRDISEDYCAHGFIAARSGEVLGKLRQTVTDMYPLYFTPMNDPYSRRKK